MHRHRRNSRSRWQAHLCLSLLLMPTVSWSQETTEVRTQLRPARDADVGERVVLTVDVLARDAWARLPSLPSLDVPGAVVFVPPSQSTRLNETIDGAAYTGQRYEWWIYPQRTGDLRIPSLPLDIETKTYVPSESINQEKRTSDAQQIRAVFPVNHPATLTFKSIRASQTWSRLDREFRVGDGITRTIDREVDDAPSLLLPPLKFTAPSGVRVAPKQASTNNQFNRGSLTGSRIDSATYLFESAGTFELPSVTFEWFDPSRRELQSKTLDGFTVNVSPAVDLSDADVLSTRVEPAKERRVFRWIWLVVCVAAVVGIGIFFRSAVTRWLVRGTALATSSEWMQFQRFVRAARSGEPARTLRELTRWADHLHGTTPTPLLSDIFSKFGDEQAGRQLDVLYGSLETESTEFHELIHSCRRIRRKARQSRRLQSLQHEVLPSLRAPVARTHVSDRQELHEQVDWIAHTR